MKKRNIEEVSGRVNLFMSIRHGCGVITSFHYCFSCNDFIMSLAISFLLSRLLGLHQDPLFISFLVYFVKAIARPPKSYCFLNYTKAPFPFEVSRESNSMGSVHFLVQKVSHGPTHTKFLLGGGGGGDQLNQESVDAADFNHFFPISILCLTEKSFITFFGVHFVALKNVLGLLSTSEVPAETQKALFSMYRKISLLA